MYKIDKKEQKYGASNAGDVRGTQAMEEAYKMGKTV
jgi:hypothetical protein